ncbi:MAG: WbqC family protein [Alistipes sp.]|nr:WbqC family protein [Alistipes sp.]
MVILPSAYMPSVEYVARLLREESVIDLGENFIKRSERNRASILTANGVMQLSVHVENANRPRQKMRDVKIDYSKRWQHQHWVSILSAYKSSPYFDYFAHEIEPFYKREWRYLVDYNMEYLEVLLRLLGASKSLNISDQYIMATESDLDLRPKQKKDSTFVAEPYFQVFSERMPFQPNLSILDLLMCEGRSAIDGILMCCQL